LLEHLAEDCRQLQWAYGARLLQPSTSLDVIVPVIIDRPRASGKRWERHTPVAIKTLPTNDGLAGAQGPALGFRNPGRALVAAASLMIGSFNIFGSPRTGLAEGTPAKRSDCHLPPARRDDLVLFSSTQRLIAALEPKIQRGTPVRSVHFEAQPIQPFNRFDLCLLSRLSLPWTMPQSDAASTLFLPNPPCAMALTWTGRCYCFAFQNNAYRYAS